MQSKLTKRSTSEAKEYNMRITYGKYPEGYTWEYGSVKSNYAFRLF